LGVQKHHNKKQTKIHVKNSTKSAMPVFPRCFGFIAFWVFLSKGVQKLHKILFAKNPCKKIILLGHGLHAKIHMCALELNKLRPSYIWQIASNRGR
jgi:hypothetical protein